MVTFTVPPSILYLPSTPLPEKLPDAASPLKVALFSFATFLASETSVLGLFVAFMLKVRPPPPSAPLAGPLADEEGWVFRPLKEYPRLSPAFLPRRRFGPLPRRAPFANSTAPLRFFLARLGAGLRASFFEDLFLLDLLLLWRESQVQ